MYLYARMYVDYFSARSVRWDLALTLVGGSSTSCICSEDAVRGRRIHITYSPQVTQTPLEISPSPFFLLLRGH